MLQSIVQAVTKKCSDEKENLNYYACKRAYDSLQSPTEAVKVWVVKQDIHQPIRGSFAAYGLSINCTEERTGSSCKLIVVKDDNLYQMARMRFTNLKEYQSKLSIAASEDLHV